MRESLKALNAAFSASTVPDPLPDELYATIDAFLQRYDDIDDHDSQRFHDDLHALYLRHVANSPDKRGAFLSALRLLRPAITGEARLTAWWNSALRPVIDGIGYKKSEIEDARAFVQSILVYDPGEDHDGEHARLSALFTNKILDAYLARTKVPSDAVSPESEFIAHELEAVLVAFGRKMPKVVLLPCTCTWPWLTALDPPPHTRRPPRAEATSHTGPQPAQCLCPPPAPRISTSFSKRPLSRI